MAQVHGAVCEKDGTKLFTDVTLNGLWTGWSGFSDTFDDKHKHQVLQLHLVTVKSDTPTFIAGRSWCLCP